METVQIFYLPAFFRPLDPTSRLSLYFVKVVALPSLLAIISIFLNNGAIHPPRRAQFCLGRQRGRTLLPPRTHICCTIPATTFWSTFYLPSLARAGGAWYLLPAAPLPLPRTTCHHLHLPPSTTLPSLSKAWRMPLRGSGTLPYRRCENVAWPAIWRHQSIIV